MKVYAVFRRYGSGPFNISNEFHFYQAYESRPDAKAFVDGKNSNRATLYFYKIKTINIIGKESK